MKTAVVAALALSVMPARAAPVDAGHVRLELVARTVAAPVGETFHVALTQSLDRGWHSYWRNPGDAGAPPRLAWTLPTGWTAGDIVWPTPQRLPVKTLMDYGYTGDVVLPIPITVPATARAGRTVTLKAKVDVLVCKDLCVPQSAVVTLPVRVQAGSPLPAPRSGALIDRALRAAPAPAGLTARFVRRGQVVELTVGGAVLKGAAPKDAYFYPYASDVIDHARPQTVALRDGALVFTLAAGKRPPAVLSGVIALGDRAYEVTARRAARAGR